MSKTILVTGSSGFIGFHTSLNLLSKGYHVIGIDDHNDSTSVLLKEHRQGILSRTENFTFHLGSINDEDLLENIFSKSAIAGVVNLAARAGVRKSLEDPHIYLKTNEGWLVILLSLCAKYNIKSFIQASTSSLYEGEKMPFLESMAANHPISPYAASKKGAEGYAYVYHHLYNINMTILRFFTVYGPYGRPDMSVFRFCKGIYEETPININGDGHQSRDFTYVTDVVNAVLYCLENPNGFQIYNVGNDQTHTVLEMIKEIEEAFSKKAILKFHPKDPLDMLHTRANIDKLKKIGWAPKVSFTEGLRNTVAWMKEGYDWIRHIKD